MSIEIEKFKDKETAEEVNCSYSVGNGSSAVQAVFFSKQDERLLRSLLKKVKKQADVVRDSDRWIDLRSVDPDGQA